jgi:hypothetical protein
MGVGSCPEQYCPQQWLRLLGDSPLCAEAVRRCGTELNRRERDAWLLGARLHHQTSGPGPNCQFAVAQQSVGNGGQTGQSADAVSAAGADPQRRFAATQRDTGNGGKSGPSAVVADPSPLTHRDISLRAAVLTAGPGDRSRSKARVLSSRGPKRVGAVHRITSRLSPSLPKINPTPEMLQTRRHSCARNHIGGTRPLHG